MNLIAAVDADWGLGKNGDLLFHIPDDMRFFRDTTMGGTVVMGGTTFRSLPGAKPLAGRRNVILTRCPASMYPGECTVVSSINGVLEAVAREEPSKVWIIGGGQVYAQFLPMCSRALVTVVHAHEAADCFLPDLDTAPGWQLASASAPQTHGELEFVFREYVNDAMTR